MSLYEYFTVAYSILVAVSMTRLLEGLVTICRSGNFYWIHLGWTSIHMFLAVTYWSNYWAYSRAELNYIFFLVSIIGTVRLQPI
ncbi:MAG TPA: hypothetical protein DCM64_09415, partial [Gammaproteobacteria bacterium]|mgnify:CR=1 FL=1|jgi:hypothetical protein|nr:hypothetical protein [Gammaproteobacteria bacterium]MDP6732912.1 hypothetical protein [Gammaproteobacteria bacterium]HAJ76661.1 hypothetical protein [Gammaproteobacteria bacterium]